MLISRSHRTLSVGAVGLTLAAAGSLSVFGPSAAVAAPAKHASPSRHVILLSVDGLHQADLARYVGQHPDGALAALVGRGVSFPHALTPVPSDSFPGLVGQVTGGNPRSTGIYYDDSFNHSLLPAGTTDCVGAAPGAEVTYFEALDRDPSRLDAGQGLRGLPGSILQMTPRPAQLLDPTKMPVDPASCKPVYPHSYLKVNTVFEVLRAHKLRTAWSDKHAAYDVLQGPSGKGIQDLFTPEINSDVKAGSGAGDWTADNARTQQYDNYKVQAVLHEIDGYDHSGRQHVGMPALLGMNFQSVSTAQKLPTSGGKSGGYTTQGTPGPVLSSALDFVDRSVGRMVRRLSDRHQLAGTTIILSAKHGQSPVEPSSLTRIPDGPILDGLNAAWKDAGHSGPNLVAQATDDDAMIMWLSDRSQAAADFAKAYLLNHNGTGNDIAGADKPYTSSGLKTVYAGSEAAAFFGVPAGDDRVPDLYAVAQHGVVFTGKKAKIAEHGGADPQDRNVPLVVAGPGTPHRTDSSAVQTTQIAPTILGLLGISGRELKAVQLEGTAALPLRSSAKAKALRVFATAPPIQPGSATLASKPDDITRLGQRIYVTFQNGAGKDGAPAGSFSTIAAYRADNGKLVTTYQLPGRCDGLTADPAQGRLLATVNEDNNSSLYTITPTASVPVQGYQYSPSPAETGSDGVNGGTDAVTVAPDGTVYVAHSNPDTSLPAPNNTAAVYTVTLQGNTASLSRVFGVNDQATVDNPATGAPSPAPLALTDPDSNTWLAARGGTLVQDAQGDSKLVLATDLHASQPTLHQVLLANADPTRSGKPATPQLDDLTTAGGAGQLLVVDQKSAVIYTLDTRTFPANTLFATQPAPSSGDQPNDPALAVVDLTSGVVSHLPFTLASPKGLLALPANG